MPPIRLRYPCVFNTPTRKGRLAQTKCIGKRDIAPDAPRCSGWNCYNSSQQSGIVLIAIVVPLLLGFVYWCLVIRPKRVRSRITEEQPEAGIQPARTPDEQPTEATSKPPMQSSQPSSVASPQKPPPAAPTEPTSPTIPAVQVISNASTSKSPDSDPTLKSPPEAVPLQHIGKTAISSPALKPPSGQAAQTAPTTPTKWDRLPKPQTHQAGRHPLPPGLPQRSSMHPFDLNAPQIVSIIPPPPPPLVTSTKSTGSSMFWTQNVVPGSSISPQTYPVNSASHVSNRPKSNVRDLPSQNESAIPTGCEHGVIAAQPLTSRRHHQGSLGFATKRAGPHRPHSASSSVLCLPSETSTGNNGIFKDSSHFFKTPCNRTKDERTYATGNPIAENRKHQHGEHRHIRRHRHEEACSRALEDKRRRRRVYQSSPWAYTGSRARRGRRETSRSITPDRNR